MVCFDHIQYCIFFPHNAVRLDRHDHSYSVVMCWLTNWFLQWEYNLGSWGSQIWSNANRETINYNSYFTDKETQAECGEWFIKSHVTTIRQTHPLNSDGIPNSKVFTLLPSAVRELQTKQFTKQEVGNYLCAPQKGKWVCELWYGSVVENYVAFK